MCGIRWSATEMGCVSTFTTRQVALLAARWYQCVYEGDENGWNGPQSAWLQIKALLTVQNRLIQQYTQQCFLATDHTPARYDISFDLPSGDTQSRTANPRIRCDNLLRCCNEPFLQNAYLAMVISASSRSMQHAEVSETVQASGGRNTGGTKRTCAALPDLIALFLIHAPVQDPLARRQVLWDDHTVNDLHIVRSPAGDKLSIERCKAQGMVARNEAFKLTTRRCRTARCLSDPCLRPRKLAESLRPSDDGWILCPTDPSSYRAKHAAPGSCATSRQPSCPL